MHAFDMSNLLQERAALGRPYLEFLRRPELSLGLYVLPAGGTDGQQPHTEPEVYYVVNGAATVTVAGEDRPVAPGSVVFVDAGVPHRFHTTPALAASASVTADLQLLVFFAPAEYARAAS